MKPRILELNIASLTKKGNGLAQFESDQKFFQAEIPFTIPGDTIRACLFKKHDGIYEGKSEEILKPSPDRIPAKCVHFGNCGGCRLQNFPYEDQVKHKEQFVLNCFKNLLSPDVKVLPIIPCSSIWNYRNKMEYTFSRDAAGKKYLGLILDSSRGKVFNLSECHLSNPWFVEALKCVRNWWHESGLDAYHMRSNTGSLRNLALREGLRSGDRMVILTVSGNPDYAFSKRNLESFVAFVRDALESGNPQSSLSIILRIQQIGKGMPTSIYEMLLHGPDYLRETLYVKVDPYESSEVHFHISPSAFFQPNTAQAEKVYSAALSLAAIPADAVVYDLYCGTGTLSLCISKHVKQVIGVEISPDAALDAEQNAKRNGRENITIIPGAVCHVLDNIAERQLPKPDVVVVDPPRAGLDTKTLEQLIELNPSKILYISCNPLTQARDVAALVERGYKMHCMQSVDQFPHTYHIENIVVLTK